MQQTRKRICDLFDVKRLSLSASAEHALSDLLRSGGLPLSDEHWAAIEWLYRAPKGSVDAAHKLRTSADKVAENLHGELDKARDFEKSNPRPRIFLASAQKPPADWAEVFAKKLPRAAVPESWDLVDPRLRVEICLEVAQ